MTPRRTANALWKTLRTGLVVGATLLFAYAIYAGQDREQQSIDNRISGFADPATPAAFTRYVAPDGSFAVDFPDQPFEMPQATQSWAGIPAATNRVRAFHDLTSYSVTYADLRRFAHVVQSSRSMYNQLCVKSGALEVRSQNDMPINTEDGNFCELGSPNASVYRGVLLHGSRIYVLEAQVPSSVADPRDTFDAFVDSFTAT